MYVVTYQPDHLAWLAEARKTELNSFYDHKISIEMISQQQEAIIFHLREWTKHRPNALNYKDLI